MVPRVVNLHVLSGLQEHSLEVGADARVCHTHVVGKGLDLVYGGLVDEWRGQLLLASDDAPVLGFDTEAGLSVSDSCEGVSDLGQFSTLAESRQ